MIFFLTAKMTTITSLSKDIIGYLIQYFEWHDVRSLALTCKHIARCIRLNEEWRNFIRHKGQSHFIYDGINIFSVREFLKKDKNYINRGYFNLCKTKPLNKAFIKHYCDNIKDVNSDLFMGHIETFRYVMDKYPSFTNRALCYVDEDRYHYIVQNYDIDYTSGMFGNIIRYFTEDMIQKTLRANNQDMSWFMNIYVEYIYNYANIKLIELCRSWLSPNIHKKILGNFYRVLGDNHIPFIQMDIDSDLISVNYINRIIRQSKSSKISQMLADYALSKFGLHDTVDIFVQTPNEQFFWTILSHVSDKYSSMDMTPKMKEIFIWEKNHGLKYHLEWLLRYAGILCHRRVAFIWKYIHDMYGEDAFLDTLEANIDHMPVKIIRLIKVWYPRILDII